MQTTWIEKNTTTRVKKWAFNHLKYGDMVFAADRQKDGYPVVAEVLVSDKDMERFKPDLDKAVTVIMFAAGARRIDAPGADFDISDIVFHVECCD